MLKLCSNNRYGKSNIVEIPPSLFHPFTLASAVVVFVENTRCHVRTIADDIFRNIVVQVMRDPTTPESVWTHARRAVECGGVVHCVAFIWITVMWTLSSGNTGPCVSVTITSKRRSMCAPVRWRHERLPLKLVVNIGPPIRYPVVDKPAHLVR